MKILRHMLDKKFILHIFMDTKRKRAIFNRSLSWQMESTPVHWLKFVFRAPSAVEAI